MSLSQLTFVKINQSILDSSVRIGGCSTFSFHCKLSSLKFVFLVIIYKHDTFQFDSPHSCTVSNLERLCQIIMIVVRSGHVLLFQLCPLLNGHVLPVTEACCRTSDQHNDVTKFPVFSCEIEKKRRDKSCVRIQPEQRQILTYLRFPLAESGCVTYTGHIWQSASASVNIWTKGFFISYFNERLAVHPRVQYSRFHLLVSWGSFFFTS